MTPTIDVDTIRARFPALERREEGRAVAYFDAPGGTQVPRVVADAVAGYLLHHNANTHWAFATSVETDAVIEAARAAFADFVGGAAEEIVFGANMTTLAFHVSRALGRGLGPGDTIVVTELDHHANVDPWRALERERGVAIRAVAMRPETGRLDEEDLARALDLKPRIVAVGAASNALGTINDVPCIAAAARDAGALVFVDAVHLAPHARVDVRAMGCDFLACSAYKFYGPHIGVLWGRRDLLAALDVPKVAPASDAPPERVETGTQCHEGIAGAAAAVDFLASLSPGAADRLGCASAGADRRAALDATFEALGRSEAALLERLWRGLSALPGVTLFGPPPGTPRTPTVAFEVAGHRARDVAISLARSGVFVSDGDFYAPTLLRRLGRTDLVRVGCACYTTAEDVDRLIGAVRDAVRGSAAAG